MSCPYCRTKLYLEPGDHFRYCILSRVPDDETVYLPYWRFKGSCFSFRGFEANHRFLDVNLSALPAGDIPDSLGLRPQAMHMKFVSPDVRGRFLAPRLSLQEIFKRIIENNVPGSSFHRFIGDVTSLVYSPFYWKRNIVYDAVTDKPTNIKFSMDLLLKENGEARDWRVRYISTLCPHCGWDLEGEKDAAVMICRNCHTAWRGGGTQLEGVAFSVMEHPDADVYLPFWRVQAQMEGVALDTYADLIRFANLPRAVTPVLEQKPFHFWMPAFKVNPLLYLRTARQMTIFQPEATATTDFTGRPYHPVNLAEMEAVEGVAVVAAEIATDKRRFLPVLKEAEAVRKDSLLVYHPFIMKPRELVHAQTGMALDRNALSFGAGL